MRICIGLVTYQASPIFGTSSVTGLHFQLYPSTRSGLTIIRSQLNSTFNNPASEVDDRDEDIEDRIVNTFVAAKEDPASEPFPALPVPYEAAIEPVLGYDIFFTADLLDDNLKGKVDSETSNKIAMCCFHNVGYLVFGTENEAMEAKEAAEFEVAYYG